MDRISRLPDSILNNILSDLPLKDAVKTSILAIPWRNLWCARDAIEINEHHFLDLRHHNQNGGRNVDQIQQQQQQLKQLRQRACIRWGDNWLHSPQLPRLISSFTLKFSDPQEYIFNIYYFTNIALGRGTRYLELDFSGLNWENKFPVSESYNERSDLSEMVYLYDSLETLKLVSCHVEYDNLATLGQSLTTISLGWIGFKDESNLQDLTRQCPYLESLTLFKCFDLDTYVIESQSLNTLVIDKCVDLSNLSIVAHNLTCFKYCGKVVTFGMFPFPNLEMVDLDFGLVEMFDEEHSDEIASLLSHFHNANSLIVCNYTTQVLPIANEGLTLSGPSGVRDLTIKTAFDESEFAGIKIMLDTYSFVEKLQFTYTNPSPFVEDLVEEGHFEPGTFEWKDMTPSRIGCLNNSELKEVEIDGYQGTAREDNMLLFLARYGLGLQKLTLKVAENGGQNVANRARLIQIAIQHRHPGRFEFRVM